MDEPGGKEVSLQYRPIDRAQVIKAIQEAFYNVPKPECTIRMGRAMDDNEWGKDTYEKCKKEDGYYSHWEEIREEDLQRYQDIWVWIPPDAVQFYLPAYMVHALKSDMPLWNSHWVISVFNKYCIEKGLFSTFTPEQITATHLFLTALLGPLDDEYFPDWWNHDWHEEFKQKEDIWEDFKDAFKFFEDQVIQFKKKGIK